MSEMPRIYPWGREFNWEGVYMAVSVELVEHVIDVLRAHLAAGWPEEGLSVEDDAAHRLIATSCSALGGLLNAHAAHYRRHGARELVFQIQDYLIDARGEVRAEQDVKAELEALRDERWIKPEALDALLALRGRLVSKAAGR
jgi:hypothetical protein